MAFNANFLNQRRGSIELQNSNIMQCSQKVAPRLQSIGNKLEKKINSDRLSSSLDMRVDQADLMQRGILPMNDAFVAPRIQGLAAKLERRMNTDRVGHLLESRPDYEELEELGFVKRREIMAPRIQGVANKLQRRYVFFMMYMYIDGRKKRERRIVIVICLTTVDELGGENEMEMESDGYNGYLKNTQLTFTLIFFPLFFFVFFNF